MLLLYLQQELPTAGRALQHSGSPAKGTSSLKECASNILL